MAGKNTAAFGIYPNRVALEEGLVALRDANFRHEDISILYPDNEGTKDFGHEKATKAPEGASAGAGTGAVIGGVLGWLAGIGAIAVPGIGPFPVSVLFRYRSFYRGGSYPSSPCWCGRWRRRR